MIISDVEGVLDSEKKLIPEINSKKANELIDQDIISGGMIPKIKNCLDVASNGVRGVVIIDGRKITHFYLSYYLIKVLEL